MPPQLKRQFKPAFHGYIAAHGLHGGGGKAAGGSSAAAAMAATLEVNKKGKVAGEFRSSDLINLLLDCRETFDMVEMNLKEIMDTMHQVGNTV